MAFRKVETNFWQDEKVIDEFTPEDKLFYLYLLTNEHTKQIGVYKFIKKIVAVELGYSTDTISNLLDRFEKYHNLIKYNHDTKEICILNWGKYNLNRGGKPVQDLIKKELKDVKDKTLLNYVIENSDSNINNDILSIMHEYLDGIELDFITNRDTNRDTNRGTIRRQEERRKKKEERINNKNKEKEIVESENKNQFSEDSQEMKISIYLFDSMQKNIPSKKPNYQSWCKDIDKMFRIDKRDIADIKAVIDFSQNDNFWKSNIRSTKKLREKFETLYLQMNNKNKSYNTQNKESDMEQMKRLYEQAKLKEQGGF